MNRTKVIIFSVIGLLLILFIWSVISVMNEDKAVENQGVNLAVDTPKEFTYDDMLKANERKKYSGNVNTISDVLHEERPDTGEEHYYSQSENDEAVKKIQEQIIENQQKMIKTVNSEGIPQRNEIEYPEGKKNVQQITDEVPVIQNNESGLEQSEILEESEKEELVKESSDKMKRKVGRFYSVNMKDDAVNNAIKALVYGDQEVSDGSTLKMRLSEDCITNDGMRVPKNTPVWGTVSLAGERVIVNVASIKIGNSIYPFKKKVFGADAIEGIYIPGNIKSEATKEAVGSSINNIDITSSSSTGIVGNVVGSVLDAGKRVFSKNVKKEKVFIKTNYEVYLK